MKGTEKEGKGIGMRVNERLRSAREMRRKHVC